MEVIIADIATEVNMSCRSQGSMYVCIAILLIEFIKGFFMRPYIHIFSLFLLLRYR
jgi:hypothetical protein